MKIETDIVFGVWDQNRQVVAQPVQVPIRIATTQIQVLLLLA
jgi:hypothetical protein